MAALEGLSIRPGFPDFLDLPWDQSLSEWQGQCGRLVEMPRGQSRHPVLFVNYDGIIFALKEMPTGFGESEYNILRRMEDLHLPVVTAVGHFLTRTPQGQFSVLATRYLQNSLPYSMLFVDPLQRYRQHLLDAMAGLLVQVHLAGVFWGDCSLSNTLFRRDAGALRAYLVDAETAEAPGGFFSPALRFHDLQIMEENVARDLFGIHSEEGRPVVQEGLPAEDAGPYIRLRYQRLWEEITREEYIHPEERYRIQERIRALNQLGFSVGDVELATTSGGSQLRLRIQVTDRNFHHDLLYSLTGLDAEEMQAQKMMNEIQEVRAMLSSSSNSNVPLNVAAYHWLEQTFRPVTSLLLPLAMGNLTLAELYCEVLEHKWYLSERAQRDVGHQAAVEDYRLKFSPLDDDPQASSDAPLI